MKAPDEDEVQTGREKGAGPAQRMLPSVPVWGGTLDTLSLCRYQGPQTEVPGYEQTLGCL